VSTAEHGGQALVEFALAASVFLLLILGTFDVGRGYLAYAVVSNAAREASRYAAAHASESGFAAAAQQAGANLAVGIDAAALSLAVTTQQLDGLTYITVTGTYHFHSLTPFAGGLLGDPIIIQVVTSELAG
jgi:Flp pilus assembly protein TadG